MSLNLPTSVVTCKVPSTKSWLLLLGLLALLLVVAHQLPARPAGVPAAVARPAAQLPRTARRVALESPARPAGAATLSVPTTTL